MSEREPNIVVSGWSRDVTEDGVTASLEIIRLEHEALWSMHLYAADHSCVVWDEQFDSDDAAFKTFERELAQEGLSALLASDNVIPFPEALDS